MMRRRLLYKDQGGLPAIYREVQYIEVPDRADYNPWIDTGVVPTENTRSQIKFLNKVATGDVIFGFHISASDAKCYRFFNYRQTLYVDYPTFSTYTFRLHPSPDVPILINTVYDIEIGNKYVKDLVTDATIASAESVTFWNGVIETLTLGYSVKNSTVSKNRWYYVKIYEGNNIIREMIPCIRITDNKPGMYDLVNQTFYVNQGTGEFITP